MAGLTTRYRPATLKQMFGNLSQRKEIFEYSKKEHKDRPHTFLLSGPAGTGKTTLARIAARLFGANGDDVIEYNNAAFRGIDVGREIIASMVYAPGLESSAKAYVLDEVHGLTGPAQESLLKAIEEPPSYVYFFLCTTDPQKLLKTTKSRCTHIPLSALTDDEMAQLVNYVFTEEAKRVAEDNELRIQNGQKVIPFPSEFPSEVLGRLVAAAEGSPRLALSMLESALTAKDIESAVFVADVENQEAFALCQALARGSKPDKAKVAEILEGLKSQKVEAEGIRRSVLGYAQAIALRSKFGDFKAYAILKGFETPTYNNGFVQLTTSVYDTIRYMTE